MSCFSIYGVGAVISRKLTDGSEKPITFASRSLGRAEKNYSQLEKEGLAIVFGVKFHQYLCGRHFVITSDHKPLQSILKETSAIPQMASAHIQRWALLLGGYDYTITYKPGQQHANADILSPLPSGAAPSNIPMAPETIHLLEILDSSPIASVQICQWTSQDLVLAKVRDLLLSGQYPQVKIVSPYHKVWSELSIEQGCLLRGTRVVIPLKGRVAVAKLLHEGHTGGTCMKA